jgi:hypothetical protein
MSKLVIEIIVLFLVVKLTTFLLSLMIRLVEEIVTLIIIKNITLTFSIVIITLVFVKKVGTIILWDLNTQKE